MISVIIPTLNEEKALPLTLTHVLGQPGDYEVVVVDGGSTDRTWDIADNERRIRLLHAPKGRASQMNRGAKDAAGEWLLFLHADTLLPTGALTRLNALETDVSIQAGGFFHRFSGNDWRLRLLSSLNNVRCRWSKVIYGDQAMFVRRALFERLGGFPDQPFLEDVLFSRQLIRVATPVLLTPPVVTDSRKFVQMGIWRSVARAALILLSVELAFRLSPVPFFVTFADRD